MKKSMQWAPVALSLLATFAEAATPGASAPQDWVDAATGHHVIRLSTSPGTRAIYFHQNSITPDGRFVLVEMTDGLGVIEIATRRNIRLVAGKVRALFVGRKTGLIYFSRGEDAGRPEQQKAVGVFTVPATGGEPRRIATVERGSIGSVNAAEFFVTATISAMFVATVGLELWPVILGLIVGGALAAPLAAFFTRTIPDKPLMIIVGMVILLLSVRGLLQALV